MEIENYSQIEDRKRISSAPVRNGKTGFKKTILGQKWYF